MTTETKILNVLTILSVVVGMVSGVYLTISHLIGLSVFLAWYLYLKVAKAKKPINPVMYVGIAIGMVVGVVISAIIPGL